MICRVCLKQSTFTMDIFSVENSHLKVSDIMLKHLGFKPQPNDRVSTVICLDCWTKLNDFNEFFATVDYAQANYWNLLQDNTTNVEDALNIKVEHKDETPVEVINTHINNDIILEGNIGNVQTSNAPEDDIEKCEEETNPLHEKEIYPTECLSKDLDEDTCSSSIKSELNGGSQDNYSSSDEEIMKISSKKKVTRNISRKKSNETCERTKTRKGVARHSREYIDELIKKHIPMACGLCTFLGKTFTDIMQHFLFTHPKEKPHVVCCDRKLTKRYTISQHALKHENPDYFKCEPCKKTFANDSGLRAHNLAHHTPQEQKHYKCDKCILRFSTRHLLQLHKASHIPVEERSFHCPQCPTEKAFACEYSLQIHVSMTHKREKNVCHVCAKSIRDKRAFEKHVRLHFEKSGPRVKCTYPGCESYLKDEDNLKQHMKRHNPEGKIYKCNICERVCKNRRSLSSHKRYTHSTETFRCEDCGKILRKALSLKEHMAQHTGEALYKCPFCSRTFNSSANMHSHKKKMHPIEWDAWRKSKQCSSQTIINKESKLLF